MSVLSRIFGKKPAAKARPQQITSLDTMAPESLISIARGETKTVADDQTRITAIERLDDPNTLLGLAFGDSSGSIQRAAKQRLAGLVDSGSIPLETLNAQTDGPQQLFAVMGFSQQPGQLEQLLDAQQDPDLLYATASKGATVRMRQIAAEKISDKAQLQALLKETKGKDKTVYKIVKEKCDQFKEEERLVAELQNNIQAVAQAIEHHSQRAFEPQFAAKLQHLQQQWQPLMAQADPATLARIEAALVVCQDIVFAAQEAEAKEQAKALELASADQNREEILQALAQLVRTLAVGEMPDNLDHRIAVLGEQWRAALVSKPAPASEQKTYVRLNDSVPPLRQHIEQYGSLAEHVSALQQHDPAALEERELPAAYRDLKQRLHSRDLFVGEELPVAMVSAQAALADWDKIRADKKAEVQSVQRHIGGLIRKAKDAARTGHLKQAAGLRRALDEKMPQLEQVPAHLHSQLQQLDEELDKLQDWKDYAVVPKKHDLIEQMKGLVGSSEHPDALAIKIKRLQDEWKSLSKGGGVHKENQDHDQELWEEFHEIAQTAFQPCREYFAEQAALRERNLESCKTLVAQVRQYCEQYDWDNADWKAVEKVVRVARQEWRSYSPTERAATQPVLAEFDALLGSIDARLNEEREKNHAAKQLLIERAQVLLELDDQRRAIDEVKHLQVLWQQVGVTARSVDQKLWRKFRAACDAVFAKKQQQSAEFKEELEANLASAEALTADLQVLLKESGKALIEARPKVAELQQAFHDLGPLPKARAKDVKDNFAQAVDTFEQQLRSERNAAKQQVWVNLFDLNNRVRETQLAMLEVSSEERARLTAEMREALSAQDALPTGGLKALQQKLEMSGSSDVSRNERALRLLCIRAEILNELPSPAEDQALRMEYQVKQLEQNFGQKPQDVTGESESLVFEWLSVGPVNSAIYEPLFQRFYQAWQRSFT